MLEFLKKYGTIAIIAILFAFFSFSIVDLIMERPSYDDFCAKPYPARIPKDLEECEDYEVPPEAYETCRGNIRIEYVDGCPASYTCNTCSVELQEAERLHNMTGFIVTGVLGVLAIIAGMYVQSKEEVMEWVLSGLLIGGILSVFIGTARYFGDMSRIVRPIVLLAEMALIIWIAIRTSKRK